MMPEILNLVYDSLCLTDIQLARDSIVDISIYRLSGPCEALNNSAWRYCVSDRVLAAHETACGASELAAIEGSEVEKKKDS